MEIPLKLIVETLADFAPCVSGDGKNGSYRSVRFLPNTEVVPGTLCIGYGQHVTRQLLLGRDRFGVISIGNTAVPWGADSEGMRADLVVLPDNIDPGAVFNRIQELFDEVNRCETDLMRTAATGTYQQMVERVHALTGNPIFFMDSGYRRIAMAPDRDIPNDPEWNHMRTKGFISFDMFKQLKDDQHFNEMSHCKEVNVRRWGALPYTSVTNNIHINGEFAGRVVLLDAFKPHCELDILLSQILRDALALKMSKDEAFQHIRGKSPLNTMLHDLVSGVWVEKAMVDDRLREFMGWDSGIFRVLKVPLGEIDSQTFDYYTSAIEKRVVGVSVLFNNTMVVIIHYRKTELFETVRKSVGSFLSECDLRAGLSNEFENLTALNEYHRQAELALTYAVSAKRLCLFESFMLTHLLSFCADENIQMLCHPQLLALKRYDEERGTRFLITLKAFLENERNLVKSARAIHVHRNTLVYRLEKLKELVSIDLNDQKIRLHLLLSYALMK